MGRNSLPRSSLACRCLGPKYPYLAYLLISTFPSILMFMFFIDNIKIGFLVVLKVMEEAFLICMVGVKV